MMSNVPLSFLTSYCVVVRLYFTSLVLLFARALKYVFLTFLLRSTIVGLAMSVVIIFSYLVLLAPAREHIENAMLRWILYVGNAIFQLDLVIMLLFVFFLF